MSSQDKDPLEKQDTPPESDESHSDGEGDKAEEHRELQERLTKAEQKDDSVESKLFDSQNKEGTRKSKVCPMSEPIAGRSGLQEFSMEVSGAKSDPGPTGVYSSNFQKEMNVEAKSVGENTGAKLVERGSDTTESTPPFIQSSPSTSLSPERVVPPPIPSRKHLELLRRFMESSSESGSYASDSARTSFDIPEICSEVASLSGEGSECPDAPEDQPPGHVPALRRRCSEDSDANISELPEVSGISYPSPPTVTHTSESITTSSKEYPKRTLARFQRQADEESVRSLPAMPSSKPVADMKKWRSLGEIESCRIDVDPSSESSNQDIFEHGVQFKDLQCAHEPLEVPAILQHQSKQVFDRLSRHEQREESHMPADVQMEDAAIKMQKVEGEKKVSNLGAGSSFDPSPLSKHDPDSSSAKKDIGRKSGDPLKSSSDSTEPPSTSSGEPRRDSPEIKSSPRPQTGKKSWQKTGALRSVQLPAVTSKDSAVVEEMDLLREENDPSPELMETGGNDESPEGMDTTSDKSVAGAMAKTGLFESKPSALESSDQADVSEAAGLLKVQELSIKVEKFERKAEKSKRPEAKLISSSPSRKLPATSPPKAAIGRAPKKARLDKKRRKKRRTRHDDNDSPPENVGPDYPDESESSPSPDADSPDEEETCL